MLLFIVCITHLYKLAVFLKDWHDFSLRKMDQPKWTNQNGPTKMDQSCFFTIRRSMSNLLFPSNLQLVIAKARSALLMMVVSIEHGDRH